MSQPTPDPVDGVRSGKAAGVGLERALDRAGWVILWERVWPPVAWVLTAVSLFLAASWLGLWMWLPPLGHAIGLFAFAVLTALAAVPLFFVRVPTREERLRRLDRVSGLAHRPATAISDKMATFEGDSWSKALWRAHVEQALARVRRLRAGLPFPRLPARDPYAMRALVMVLMVATFVAATGERGRRIAAAFDWQGVVLPPNFRLDAWVSPPPYTAKPPIILPGLRPGEATPAEASAVSVPAGSVLIVRASGQAQFDVAVKGGLKEVAGDQRPQAPAGTEERRFNITDRGTATLSGIGNDDIVWAFNAIPDRPPTIALAKEPEPQARGALALSYKLEDDYGVAEAHATFALKDAANAPHPLYGPPDFALSLPQARTRNGVGQTTKDLTENPWAGAEVNLTLTAKDDAGNEGHSEPYAMRLPERPFFKPLARALIEQRRELALDTDARDRVLIALDALAIAPEHFTPETSIFLGLRSIYWSLSGAKTDDDLRGVVARLWQMATEIEDGNVSDSEAALRQAQERLRDALERGASDEEIKKLTEDLRAALDKFLQALAEQMRKNPQMAQRPLDRNMRELSRRDLQSMIDRMERLARSGAKDAARQLLDQMQQMLENLQMARPGESDDDDMMSALDDLGDMIRQQQQLRDKTFRQGQDQHGRQQQGQQGRRRQPGQQGQQGQKGQQGQQGQQGDQQQGDEDGFGELQQNQQALRDRLNKLLDQLRQKGLGQQPGDGQQGNQLDSLGDAGSAMGDAQESLGEGNADSAVDSQRRALDAMRKGAQNLAQQLQDQIGQGQGQGQPGSRGQARAQQDTDPLGRPLHGRDYDDSSVKVPGEMDVQRARRILEELRRRLGDTARSQMELDYIERLLKDY